MHHRPTSPFTSPPPQSRHNWKDAEVLDERALASATGAIRPDLVSVWVRRWNAWHPVVLTGWQQLPRGDWAVRLKTGPSEPEVWVRYKGAALQPIQSLPPGQDLR